MLLIQRSSSKDICSMPVLNGLENTACTIINMIPEDGELLDATDFLNETNLSIVTDHEEDEAVDVEEEVVDLQDSSSGH